MHARTQTSGSSDLTRATKISVVWAVSELGGGGAGLLKCGLSLEENKLFKAS